MEPSVLLAFGAGVAGVIGAWEALVAVELTRAAALVEGGLAPLVRAGREGRIATAPERRRLALLAAAAGGVAGWLAGGAVGALTAVGGGPLAAVALLRMRRARYLARLQAAAPTVARALADALAAGHAPRGAIAIAARGVRGPAGHALAQASRALALGEPTEPVLEALRRRAGAPAWDTLVAAILLQRDAGGDLVGALRDLAEALERAVRDAEAARAATEQARFTARIVTGLPLAAAALTEFGSPGLTAGLLADPLSATLIVLAALLQVLAFVAVRRLGQGLR